MLKLDPLFLHLPHLVDELLLLNLKSVGIWVKRNASWRLGKPDNGLSGHGVELLGSSIWWKFVKQLNVDVDVDLTSWEFVTLQVEYFLYCCVS